MHRLLRSAAFRRAQETIVRGAKKKEEAVIVQSQDRINIFKKLSDNVWLPMNQLPSFLREYPERVPWLLQQTRILEGEYTMKQLLPTEYKRYLKGFKRENLKFGMYYKKYMRKIVVDESDVDMYEPFKFEMTLTPEERLREMEPTTVEEQSQSEEEGGGAPKGRRRQQ